MSLYYLEGNLVSDARIIVVDESDWTVKSSSNHSAGTWTVEDLDDTTYFVSARKSDGEGVSYGNITPAQIPLVMYDTFEGTTLDTNKWQVYKKDDSSVTVNDALELYVPSGYAHQGANAQTKTTWSRSGTLLITGEWWLSTGSWYAVGDNTSIGILNAAQASSRGGTYMNPSSSYNYVYFGVQYDQIRPHVGTAEVNHDNILGTYVSRGSWQPFYWEVNLETGAYTVEAFGRTAYSNTFGSSVIASRLGDNVVVELQCREYDNENTHKFRNITIQKL